MDVITFLCFLGLCAGIKRFTHFPLERAPFLAVSCIISFLYVFAYVNFLDLGAGILLALGALFLFFCSVECAFNNKKIADYITPGVLTWLIVVVVLCMVASTEQWVYGDELMHWGPHSKIMFDRHGFMTAEDALFHKSYPPGARLFHYFFYTLGGFSEGRALAAQVLMMLAPLCLFAENLRFNEWRKACLLVMIAFLVVVLYSARTGPLLSLLMDGSVGVFLGGMLALYFLSQRKWPDIAGLIPVVFAVTLFKLKISPLIFLFIGIIALDQCLAYYFERKIQYAALSAIGGLMVAVFVADKSWLAYLASAHIPLEWNQPIVWQHVITSFLSQTSDRELIIIERFKEYLWGQCSLIGALMIVSFVGPLVLHSFQDKLRFWVGALCLSAGFWLYLAGLLGLYLYVFSAFHGSILASILRYSGIYFIAWTFYVLALIVSVLREIQISFMRRLENSALAVGAIIVTLSLFFTMQNAAEEEKEKRSRPQLRRELDSIAERVRAKTPKTSRIFLVWQNSMGYQAVTLMYDLLPRACNERPVAFGAPYSAAGPWTQDITPGEFLKRISLYDYLLLAYTDKKFWDRYGMLFGKPETLTPLVTYTQCEGDQFNDALELGCRPVLHKAFLFKIHHNRLEELS